MQSNVNSKAKKELIVLKALADRYVKAPYASEMLQQLGEQQMRIAREALQSSELYPTVMMIPGRAEHKYLLNK